MSPFWRDWLERVLWTAAQAVVAVIIVQVGNLDGAYVPVLTALLSALKGFIAKHVGNSDTAALDGKH